MDALKLAMLQVLDTCSAAVGRLKFPLALPVTHWCCHARIGCFRPSRHIRGSVHCNMHLSGDYGTESIIALFCNIAMILRCCLTLRLRKGMLRTHHCRDDEAQVESTCRQGQAWIQSAWQLCCGTRPQVAQRLAFHLVQPPHSRHEWGQKQTEPSPRAQAALLAGSGLPHTHL